MRELSDPAAVEARRILEVYARRGDEKRDAYAPWRPDEIFMRSGRRRMAAALLVEAGAFPRRGDPCLEVGYGSIGWLGELLSWGLRMTDLHGIELDPARARVASEALPTADLRVGDATGLPWADGAFHLVIVSTVFSSILDFRVRRRVAEEIGRVLAPEGAILWYDLAWNNPRNRDVRKVGRKELMELFPGFRGRIRSVTLAPPVARRIAPMSWALATMLESIPFLRTHWLAVLRRSG